MLRGAGSLLFNFPPLQKAGGGGARGPGLELRFEKSDQFLFLLLGQGLGRSLDFGQRTHKAIVSGQFSTGQPGRAMWSRGRRGGRMRAESVAKCESAKVRKPLGNAETLKC